MKKLVLAFYSFLFAIGIFGQTNLTFTNSTSEQIIRGNYNPSDYSSSNPIATKQAILSQLMNNISPDSLKAYIEVLATFHNRNTGADTIAQTTGIGAARRWAKSKFDEFSTANENRLVNGFFQFDQNICGVGQHRNIISVLPGTDALNHKVIIIEGHIDSRCEDPCDTTCQALGIEDNASGTALVMELARVMGSCSYPNTIVFMLTIGEEQGLYGADAMALFCQIENIPVKTVQNNDVIGGIICGATSSSPSCPGLNHIDSTQVRIFSVGGFNSAHKQFARFTKLEYKEELLGLVDVPMQITIMASEDRTGRGGDHIPFRQRGFTAVRFCSANEHGDASNGPGYTDRQHTQDDILGIDIDSNGTIDSFFVDFNYLKRNTVINAMAASITAIGPETPDFDLLADSGSPDNQVTIIITDQTQYSQYRVAVRTTSNDWDSVYTINGTSGIISVPPTQLTYFSVASVDTNGLESLFSGEKLLHESMLSTEEISKTNMPFSLLQNRPNPFDEATIIGVQLHTKAIYKNAEIKIHDVKGKLVKTLPIDLTSEINEVEYHHGYGKVGTFIYSLWVDGKKMDQKQMVFAN